MDQLESIKWEPLKRAHPLFNSLVIKMVLALALPIYWISTISPYSLYYLFDDDKILIAINLLGMYLVFLVILSIAEALVMTALSVVQSIFFRNDRIKETNNDL